jgi:hypothetical protein
MIELDDVPEFEYWPKIGTSLFVAGEFRCGAPVTTWSNERHFRMMSGFRLAADILVDHAEENTDKRRELIWPIVFSYRQHIELMLKSAIEDYGRYVTPEIPADCTSHKLDVLWEKYKKLFNGRESEEFQAVEAYIKEFQGIDPDSYVFRYRTDTKGKQNEIRFASIDLCHLKIMMVGVTNFFECADAELHRIFIDS